MSLKLVIPLLMCQVFIGHCLQIRCPPGTLQALTDQKFCFAMSTTADTFDNAQLRCEEKNGRLVQIYDSYLNQLIQAFADGIVDYHHRYWIGGSTFSQPATNNYNIWKWTDNSVITYFNFNENSGAVLPILQKTCISVLSFNNTWYATDCSERLYYACQIPFQVGVCESEWLYDDLTHRCYRMFAESSVNQIIAENRCVELGAHLVSIDDDYEQDMITNLAMVSRPGEAKDVGVWTGGKNLWHWTDGTVFNFTHWGKYEPGPYINTGIMLFPDGITDNPRPEDFVGKWRNVGQEEEVNRYICEKELLFESVIVS